jgi:hypothetical protein
MRYRVAALAGYVGLMLFWIYGALDGGRDVPETLTMIVLAGAQVLIGVSLGGWALLLPPALVLMSVPAGYGDAPTSSEEFPIWFGLMFAAVPAITLVAFGWLVRLAAKWQLRTG